MRANRVPTRWMRLEPRPRYPTIESMHRDIALANSYRMELLKHLLTITAALFAFTVAFRPTLDVVQWRWAMWIGWIGLGLSMIGGMVHMLGWDHYYRSYRDFDWKLRNDSDEGRGRREGEGKRSEVNLWRDTAMWFQYLGFAIGVVGVGAFAAVNIDHAHTQPTASTPVSSATPVVPSTVAPSPATPAPPASPAPAPATASEAKP